MKKTITVNLNGIVFNIDDDAYLYLENYLKKIETHFSGQEGAAEIMNDIEGRIAELLNERTGYQRRVVTLSDIESVVRTMGNPGDFSDTAETDFKDERKSYYTYRRRRVYRDPDNRVLGGVCGGLGAYLSMDPLILRILFIVIFFGFGAGLLIYIILWIIIPEAKTTAQKLEMRGDPVNISNIGNFIRDEFDHVKKNFSRKK
jgi:phage shock protein PspC (stress-responsive transcriptional regulator)